MKKLSCLATATFGAALALACSHEAAQNAIPADFEEFNRRAFRIDIAKINGCTNDNHTVTATFPVLLWAPDVMNKMPPNIDDHELNKVLDKILDDMQLSKNISAVWAKTAPRLDSADIEEGTTFTSKMIKITAPQFGGLKAEAEKTGVHVRFDDPYVTSLKPGCKP